ncbi:oligosaccharide flippase family protein [Patescibacteria group bacterium]
MLEKLKNKTYNLLRWSEKYTKTDMIYFTSGNFWLLLGQIIPTAVGISLTIAFANLLPKEVFGTYKYVLSIAGFLSAFSLTGMWTALLKDVAQGREGVIKSAFWISFRWSLGASAIALILATYYFVKGNLVLGISSSLIALSLPILNSGSLYPAFLSGKKDFKLFSVTRILSGVIITGTMIATLFVTQNIIIIITAYFIITTAVSLSFYLFTVNKYKTIKEAISKETLRYAKHLSFMGILGRLADHLDKLLLWHFAGPIQLAIYTFATKPIIELRGLLGNVFPLALPKFSNKSIDEVYKNLPLRMLQSIIIIIPIIILYVVLAPFLFKYVFPEYTEAIIYSQLFSLILLLEPKGFIGTALVAHAKVKEQYILNITGSVSKILLLIFLLPTFGILGAIIALIGSEIFIAIVLLFFFLRKM